MPTPRYRRRRPDERTKFSLPITQPKGPRPGPEVLPWYWHPEREGAQPAPAAFRARLKEIDPDLRAIFSPVHERWLIWVKNPARRNALSSGWQLIFLWEHPVTNEYLPLNELVFHNLFAVMRHRFPRALAYYEKIQAGIEKGKEARQREHATNQHAEQDDFYNSLQISTAGRGNRAALHHSGTIVPSQGEAAWRAQTRKTRLPSAALKQEQDDKERTFYGR